MRTVSGPSDRVVVVGAGLAGLSAAAHLAGAGREVVVLDRRPGTGGVCTVLEQDGYTFDAGPTVMTMPDLLEDAYAALGEPMDRWVRMKRLDPAYRAVYADGSRIDVRATVDDTADEIAAVCGPAEAQGFRDLAAWAEKLYRVEFDTFVARNVDSPLSLVTPTLARLVAMGAFGSLAGKVDHFLADPRTRKLFSFQALYAGVAPKVARAVYAVIAYMDSVAGVYIPEGGMSRVAGGLADALRARGVRFELGTEVVGLDVHGDRVTGVRTEGGLVPADAVVLTCDPQDARAMLGRTPRRGVVRSPSCLLMHLGGTMPDPYDAHHAIHFGDAWDETFRDLTRGGRLMRDPSILVTSTSHSVPELVPDGRRSFYVLAPTPNLTAPLDWSAIGASYAEDVLRTLEGRGYDWSGVETRIAVTPADWQAQGLREGTPFSLSHTMAQTGPFRPRNLVRGVQNVVLAGMGTTPGVGVPTAIVSGRLAAQRIAGPRV